MHQNPRKSAADATKNRPVLNKRKTPTNLQNTSSDSSTPSSTRRRDDHADTSDTEPSPPTSTQRRQVRQQQQLRIQQRLQQQQQQFQQQLAPLASPSQQKHHQQTSSSPQVTAFTPSAQSHNRSRIVNLADEMVESPQQQQPPMTRRSKPSSVNRLTTLTPRNPYQCSQRELVQALIASPLSVASTQRSLSVLSESTTQDEPIESLKRRGADVNLTANRQLYNFAQATLATPINAIVREYKKKIRTILPFDFQCQAQKMNKPKNRYSDIFCIDKTRVILREDDGQPRRDGDYIHANYVSSDECKCHILTQGPKQNTISDFWHMVWQVQCPLIIMLCENVENGHQKCIKYLPPRNSRVRIGDIVVETSGSLLHARGQLIETRLMLSKDTSKSLNVKHWKWVGWPDHKVPTDYQTVFRLLRECRHSEYGYPVIHCSAGVGRSGTLIALEVCLGMLRSGKPLNIRQCVEIVRHQRAQSVQTVSQYLFLHMALLEMALANDYIDQKQMFDFRKAYERICKNKIFSFR